MHFFIIKSIWECVHYQTVKKQRMAENIQLLNQTEFAGTVMLNNGHKAKILLDTFSEIVRFLIEILLKQL